MTCARLPLAMRAQVEQSRFAKLEQARMLARIGQYSQAMTIYRQEFGTTPPPGDWALAFYGAESATDEGRSHAVAGLRLLVEKYPSDARYQIALGRILTYSTKMRPEGRRYLERYPSDREAVEALRQSLLWDAADPASAAEVHAYLAKHPDTQLLLAVQNKLTQSRNVPPQRLEERGDLQARNTQTIEEEAAFRALDTHRLQEAERRFKEILAKHPESGPALAGMGYIRMQGANFGAAISFLVQAKQAGIDDTELEAALSTSRFWYTMGEGQAALNASDLSAAEKQYRSALSMRPNSPEALEGLGTTLLKAQEPGPAIPLFEHFAESRPMNPMAWRGLFLAQHATGDVAGALLTQRRIPPTVNDQLMRDPEFLRTLASAYSAAGQDTDAQRVLRSALDLPFPPGAEGLKSETRLQFASLLQQANHLDQADGLYHQVLLSNPQNTNAWQGLVRVQHAMAHDSQALQTIESMPSAVHANAMRDPGFETEVAAIYQAQGKLDIAQDLLEKSLAQQANSGQNLSLPTQIQLAGIYLQRNKAQVAYPIYQRVLSEHPDRMDAWKGLLGALHASGRNREALAETQQIPPNTRSRLENDPEYLQGVSAIYQSLGQPKQAGIFVARAEQIYRLQHKAPPADMEIQSAWSLLSSDNDSALYQQLMALGDRNDLTEEQRRTIQTQWASWAVRRAIQATAGKDNMRALAILNAAAKAFPDNPGVLNALAGGYVRAGLPKQGIAIFKAQDMTQTTASAYKAAIGAALAASDTRDAETWLRYGLDAYPRDAQMLLLGAKFEQARGDSRRAADYYRASLAAMPPADPGAELAEQLSRSVSWSEIHLPNATQSQDLATLLAPRTPDSPNPTIPLGSAYLPSYGNSYGSAPIQLNQTSDPLPPSSVVPSYMGNPTLAPPKSSPQREPTRLKDYVPPNTSNSRPSTLDDYVLPAASFQSGLPITPAPSIRDQALAEVRSRFASPSGHYVRSSVRNRPRGVRKAAPSAPPISMVAYTQPPEAPAPTPTTETVYGPYVPYVAPAGRSSSASHELAKGRVTAVRQGHTDPVLSGQSNPPAEEDSQPITQNVQYVTPRSSGLEPQPDPVSRPSTPLVRSMANSGALRSVQSSPSGPASSEALQSRGSSDSDSQQYPRPRRAPASATAVRRSTPPRQASSVSSPAAGIRTEPQLPGVNHALVPQLPSEAPYNGSTQTDPYPPAPTDAELVARNVPPLRGGYSLQVPLPHPQLSEREQAERDLASLEASYSGWLGGTGFALYRGGTIGLDRLMDVEAPIELSAVLGRKVRATIIPRPVFLNSGVLDVAAFQGVTGPVPILGTFPANSSNAPTQQVSNGIGGEAQLTTTNFGIGVGYTPYEFLVRNLTARLRYRPGGGHFSFLFDRDTIKETQLSYAGLRDPGSISTVYAGNIWGGVVSSGGSLRLDLGSEKSGFYLSGGGSTLNGYHTLDNTSYNSTAGGYFRVKVWPQYGSLSVGGSLYGAHFAHNERGMTYGQGGYFSPDVYFVAAVPVTFSGHYRTNFHYFISGSGGVQTFQEDSAPYYPLDASLQLSALARCSPASISARTCGYMPVSGSTGGSYTFTAQGTYRVADDWYFGAFISASNTNIYNTVSGGFYLRYLFHAQFPSEDYPTGLFPVEGFRPIRIP